MPIRCVVIVGPVSPSASRSRSVKFIYIMLTASALGRRRRRVLMCGRSRFRACTHQQRRKHFAIPRCAPLGWCMSWICISGNVANCGTHDCDVIVSASGQFASIYITHWYCSCCCSLLNFFVVAKKAFQPFYNFSMCLIKILVLWLCKSYFTQLFLSTQHSSL